MIKLTILGNMTKEPELRKVNGKGEEISVCEFNLAANGRNSKDTTFFHCTAWRGLAEMIARNCHKGNRVCVIGSVKANAYLSTTDKTPKASLEVNVEEFEFCEKKQKSDDNEPNGMTRINNDEDMPF